MLRHLAAGHEYKWQGNERAVGIRRDVNVLFQYLISQFRNFSIPHHFSMQRVSSNLSLNNVPALRHSGSTLPRKKADGLNCAAKSQFSGVIGRQIRRICSHTQHRVSGSLAEASIANVILWSGALSLAVSGMQFSRPLSTLRRPPDRTHAWRLSYLSTGGKSV